MLYSGSMDHSIKVWDMDTLDCKMTLSGHADTVTSLICWDSYLLSSSFDCTVKVWVATEEGSLKVTYTHREENGVLALCGMTDADAKPILFCSCLDNSVRLYELPSCVNLTLVLFHNFHCYVCYAYSSMLLTLLTAPPFTDFQRGVGYLQDEKCDHLR